MSWYITYSKTIFAVWWDHSTFLKYHIYLTSLWWGMSSVFKSTYVYILIKNLPVIEICIIFINLHGNLIEKTVWDFCILPYYNFKCYHWGYSN